MLVFDKRLLKTRRINQIITPVYADEEKSEDLLGYLYSDLDTYRQATILMVRFEGELNSLTSLLNIPQDNINYIEYFRDRVPQPFKMLAPYLGLIHYSEKLKEDLEDLTSHLHIIGRAISFSDFITVPAAARVNVTFTKTAFLTMREEIKDYVTGMYEKEKDESPDGVYWVSSEEIERVGKMAEAITSAFGVMAVQASNQVASSFSNSADTSAGEDGLAAVQRELADFEDNFDPAEWADFQPAQIATDFSALTGGVTQTTTTTTATSAQAAPAATQSTPAPSMTLDDEMDGEDALMMMAVAGTTSTNNLMGG